MSRTLPVNIAKYFWDVDISQIDYQKKSMYVIERILEYEDIDALHWLLRTFDTKLISESLRKSKLLSSKSAHFYSYYFNIPPNKILCLQKDFRNKHRAIWNH